ncbi:hypothetical protein OB13_05100 [Pontibacter sp. HJ8]
MSNKKTINYIGIIAVLLAVTGAVINIGHFFDNKFIGWSFIWSGLALAIANTWYTIRKHRR